jgi:hypothetical protein
MKVIKQIKLWKSVNIIRNTDTENTERNEFQNKINNCNCNDDESKARQTKNRKKNYLTDAWTNTKLNVIDWIISDYFSFLFRYVTTQIAPC